MRSPNYSLLFLLFVTALQTRNTFTSSCRTKPHFRSSDRESQSASLDSDDLDGLTREASCTEAIERNDGTTRVVQNLDPWNNQQIRSILHSLSRAKGLCVCTLCVCLHTCAYVRLSQCLPVFPVSLFAATCTNGCCAWVSLFLSNVHRGVVQGDE